MAVAILSRDTIIQLTKIVGLCLRITQVVYDHEIWLFLNLYTRIKRTLTEGGYLKCFQPFACYLFLPKLPLLLTPPTQKPS